MHYADLIYFSFYSLRYIPLGEDEVAPPWNETAHLSDVPLTLSQSTVASTVRSTSSLASQTHKASAVETSHSISSAVSQTLGTTTSELIPGTPLLAHTPGAIQVIEATPCRPVGRISRKRPLQALDDTIVLDSSPEMVDLTQS